MASTFTRREDVLREIEKAVQDNLLNVACEWERHENQPTVLVVTSNETNASVGIKQEFNEERDEVTSVRILMPLDDAQLLSAVRRGRMSVGMRIRFTNLAKDTVYVETANTSRNFQRDRLAFVAFPTPIGGVKMEKILGLINTLFDKVKEGEARDPPSPQPDRRKQKRKC